MDILNNYLVQGIIDSGIHQDGGPKCYAEIPKDYHVIVSIFFTIMHYFIIKYWGYALTDKQQKMHHNKKSSKLEKFVAVNGIISLFLTFYYKLMTGKGLFIFNPCHISILVLIILLLAPTTNFTRKLHTCWASWLFGAMMAIGLPHLEGIGEFQVYNYYFQHLLITPIGPIMLYRRYGFVFPAFKNQMAAYATFVIYQLAILVPLGLLTQVNLDFALCHSPATPFYQTVGYHYLSGGVFFLNVCSYIARMLNYILVLPLKFYFDSKIAKNKEKGEQNQSPKAKKIRRQ